MCYDSVYRLQLTAVYCRQEALTVEAEADELAGEQTWPVGEEIGAEGEGEGGDGSGRVRRNVPVEVRLEGLVY